MRREIGRERGREERGVFLENRERIHVHLYIYIYIYKLPQAGATISDHSKRTWSIISLNSDISGTSDSPQMIDTSTVSCGFDHCEYTSERLNG